MAYPPRGKGGVEKLKPHLDPPGLLVPPPPPPAPAPPSGGVAPPESIGFTLNRLSLTLSTSPKLLLLWTIIIFFFFFLLSMIPIFGEDILKLFSANRNYPLEYILLSLVELPEELQQRQESWVGVVTWAG
uniref:Uncharacterized protein n=1 Tax=Opuntia streptacantha TaxID=393608 RepID=A0A7C9F7Z4_OPUST